MSIRHSVKRHRRAALAFVAVLGVSVPVAAGPAVTEVKLAPPAFGFSGAQPTSGVRLTTQLSDVEASKFPEVSALLTVTGENNQPVHGLTREAFTLTEDGQPVDLTEVAVDETPLTVALVLDVSGSMEPAMADLKQAVGESIRELSDADDVMLFSFGDRARELPGTSRREALTQVQQLEPKGATALYDGIELGLKRLNQRSGRRFLVCFTDGRDQNADGTGAQSAVSARSVAKLALESRIPVFTIGLGSHVDRSLLGKLASLTGGHFYNPKEASLLRRVFARALVDLRLQYRVTYRTPKDVPDGTTRVLEITSRSQGREGQGRADYVAPKPPPPPPAAPSGQHLKQIAGQIRSFSRVRVGGFPEKEFRGHVDVQEQYRSGEWHLAHDHHDIPLYDGESEVKKFVPGTYRFSVRGSSWDDPVLFSVDIELVGGENILITPAGISQEPEPDSFDETGENGDGDESAATGSESGALPAVTQVTGLLRAISRVRISGFPAREYAGHCNVLQQDEKQEWVLPENHSSLSISYEGESELKKFLPGLYRFSIRGSGSQDPVAYSVDIELAGGENILITPQGVVSGPTLEEVGLTEEADEEAD